MRRRTFLRAGSVTGAVLAGGLGSTQATAEPEEPEAEAGAVRAVPPIRVSDLFTKPVVDGSKLPRYQRELPQPTRVDGVKAGQLNIVMRETQQDILGGGYGLKTTLWGYGVLPSADPKGKAAVTYPGPTLVAAENTNLGVNWLNDLPDAHMLPVDTSLHWAGVPTAQKKGIPTVVHLHGAHVVPEFDGHAEAWYTATGYKGPTYVTTNYQYENTQEAATLWYHDHAIGLTRLNVYAGLTGFYFVRDDNEARLIRDKFLPTGVYEREIVLQDRYFYPDGQLAYPDKREPGWPYPSIIAGWSGDVAVVNGVAWPYLDVEPRMYRLRLLNGSNSKTYSLRIRGPKAVGIPWLVPTYQIATDGGFLAAPYPLSVNLPIAPSERVELIVDFTHSAGGEFILEHNASTGEKTDELEFLKFRVTKDLDRAVAPTKLPTELRAKPFAVAKPAYVTRRVVLAFREDKYKRFKLMLGTVDNGALTWSDAATETPALGTTEIWEIYTEMTGAHPIHLHLVQFEVLGRWPATLTKNKDGTYTTVVDETKPQPPFPTERGPKDTVQVPGGRVTRVKATFDKPGMYMWHCHILEHEDHEMIRPLEVIGSAVIPVSTEQS